MRQRFLSLGRLTLALMTALASPLIMPSEAATLRIDLATIATSAQRNDASVRLLQKHKRNAAKKKIDSQLLSAIYRKRGLGAVPGVPPEASRVQFDEKGRAIVSIRARVTRTIEIAIRKMGGRIISSSLRYNDIRAHLPLDKLERLASLKDVFAIMPAEEAMTNDAP